MISQFRLTLALSLLVTGLCHASAQENKRDEVLGRFVGIWKLDGEARPSKWTPDGRTISGHESVIWGLKNRVILIRAIDRIDKHKSLFIATHDPDKGVYPFWGFDSRGLMGAQWELKWNEDEQATVGRATDLPTGWTSNGVNQFPDTDTNNVTAWIKDDVGEVLLNHKFTKKRRPDKDGPAIAAAWSRIEARDDLPRELKVLDRMVGTWDAVHIMKPAVWTPNGDRTTSTVTREWILDGQFLLDTSKHSTGQEGMFLVGFDPQRKAYRSWWFNSEGHRGPSQGEWNEKTQTLNYVGEPQDGKTTRSSVRFADPNHEVAEIKVTDADGKVYFDMDIILTRRKQEPE